MAVVYTKKEQGITISVGTGAPVHAASSGDEYTDLTAGTKYIYDTAWAALSTSGGGGATPTNTLIVTKLYLSNNL